MPVEIPAVMCMRHWNKLTEKQRESMSLLYDGIREGTINDDSLLDCAKAIGKALRRAELGSN